MEPVADILDEIVIRCFAWRYEILGWAAGIILGLVVVCRLLAAYKSLHSSFGSRERYYETPWLNTPDDLPE